MDRIRVRIPATSANLGPGFDSLALAVRLDNELTVESIGSGIELQIEGEGRETLPTGEDNLIVRAARSLASAHGRQLPAVALVCRNHIPLAAGLGSSAAAIVAGLLAADALLETQLPRAELLAHAAQLEGHPDNAAAALFGGLVIVGPGSQPPLFRRVEPAIDELVVVIPELDLPTRRMRDALPDQVPLSDAAFNLGRTTLTVEALRTGEFSLLADAMDDRLHQPYRQAHIPGFEAAVSAAKAAGAAGVALSGAGPGLIAFAERELAQVGRAMVDGFQAAGVSARELVLPVDLQGAQVEVE